MHDVDAKVLVADTVRGNDGMCDGRSSAGDVAEDAYSGISSGLCIIIGPFPESVLLTITLSLTY
jgi:hypothetical protein